jgi:hypothetical protein
MQFILRPWHIGFAILCGLSDIQLVDDVVYFEAGPAKK